MRRPGVIRMHTIRPMCTREDRRAGSDRSSVREWSRELPDAAISRMAQRTSVATPGSLVQVIVPESRPDLNPDARRSSLRVVRHATDFGTPRWP